MVLCYCLTLSVGKITHWSSVVDIIFTHAVCACVQHYNQHIKSSRDTQSQDKESHYKIPDSSQLIYECVVSSVVCQLLWLLLITHHSNQHFFSSIFFCWNRQFSHRLCLHRDCVHGQFNFFGGPYLLINFSECSKRDEKLARNSARERESDKRSLPNLFHKRAELQRAIIVVETLKSGTSKYTHNLAVGHRVRPQQNTQKPYTTHNNRLTFNVKIQSKPNRTEPKTQANTSTATDTLYRNHLVRVRYYLLLANGYRWSQLRFTAVPK